MKTTTATNNNNTEKRASVRYNNVNTAFKKLFKSWRALGFSYEDARQYAMEQIEQAKHLNMVK